MITNHQQTILDILTSNNIPISSELYGFIDLFYGERFNRIWDAFSAVNGRLPEDPGVTIARFLIHAPHELEGGQVLLAVANEACANQFKDALISHGKDEITHHKMFLSMATKVAQQFSLGEVECEEIDIKPIVAVFDGPDGWKHLHTSIFWAESRNIFILNQYIHFLKRCTWPAVNMITAQIKKILQDEVRHVCYSAEVMNLILSDRTYFEKTQKYLDDYDRTCWQEVGECVEYFRDYEKIAV